MKPRPAVFVDRKLKQRVIQVRVYLRTLQLYFRVAEWPGASGRRYVPAWSVDVSTVEVHNGLSSRSRAGFGPLHEDRGFLPVP